MLKCKNSQLTLSLKPSIYSASILTFTKSTRQINAEYIDGFKLSVSWLFLHFSIYPKTQKEKKPPKPKKEKPKKEKQEEPAEEKPKKPNIFKTFYENQGMDGVIKLVKDSADAVGLMMRSVKKHFIIEELYLWIVVSSNSDAAQTALQYGEICEDVFPALGFICSNLKVKKYDASIEPDFIGTFSSAQFKTAFSLRPFFLVGAGIRLVFRLLFKVVLKLLRQKPKKAVVTEGDNKTETQNIQGGASK